MATKEQVSIQNGRMDEELLDIGGDRPLPTVSQESVILAIIFTPSAVGQRGKQIFSYALNRQTQAGGRGSKKIEEVELGQLVLNRGVNFVDAAEWAKVEAMPTNESPLKWMKTKGALLIYAPDADEPVGATSDYADISTVADIVNNCEDVDWLRRSLARDQRRPVFELISQQLKEIEENKKQREQQSMSF